MNGHVSEYELQRQKNIAENKKILASLGLDKFKVSIPAATNSRPRMPHVWTCKRQLNPTRPSRDNLSGKGCRGGN